MEMKTKKGLFVSVLLSILLISPAAFADFDSGSTGADGAFAPSADTVLQIPASGVFNFTTVTIPEGVTVTFPKTTKNLPVIILATGDVTINGTISVNGGDAATSLIGAGGSGGFDGGRGGLVNQNGKAGGGPGGGGGGYATTTSYLCGGNAGGAGYTMPGVKGALVTGCPSPGAGGSVYGNEGIFPSIGGSGGGGGGGTTGSAGGDGGGGSGSITIASSGAIAINGGITANGGNGAHGEIYSPYYAGGGGGGGSGGSVRLLANILSGNGALSAIGGTGGRGYSGYGGAGAIGRIRLEAATIQRTSPTTPAASIAYPSAVEPSGIPTLKITAIGGIYVPESPSGYYHSPDVTLPFSTQNPVTVTVSAENIPAGQTVTVMALPEEGTSTSATGTLSGTETNTTADAALTLSTTSPSVLMATVTYELSAMNIESFYINGEKVERVRLAANLGGASNVTYITASGKEIPAEL